MYAFLRCSLNLTLFSNEFVFTFTVASSLKVCNVMQSMVLRVLGGLVKIFVNILLA